jgi:MFS family permease
MSDDHNNTTEWQRLKKIITKRQNWHIALTGFCCWGPIAVFAELWGIQYIHHDLGLSIDLAAVQLLWVWVGIAIMSPIVGWWSDNIQSRKTPILICFSIGLLATLLLILPEKASLWTLDITMFLLGTSAGIQPITFGLIREQNSQTVAGTAIAFNNMAVIFGGVILQPLFGFLLDFFWQGSLLNGVRMYGIFEYQHAMWILPFCCLIGFFNTLWFVDETNCQRIDVS